jgi:hypothetical protein
MPSTIIVIGNGPSLRGFDFHRLASVDTLGMNAAYRYWDRIGWYPTHYCCLDVELVATHHQAIRRLVESGQVQTAFLHGRFLDFFPEVAGDERYVFLDQVAFNWNPERAEPHGLTAIDHTIFRTSQPTKITTGSYAVRYAIYRGYDRIGLIGIDLHYVEQIPEAEQREGLQLVVTRTPERNPNYFFDDYQQAGDRFQVPNPEVHQFDLHPTSFAALRDDICWQRLPVQVVNCNLQSELQSRGIFPYMALTRFLGQRGIDALVVPTQVKERDRILANLHLWQQPQFAPFLHCQGRTRPRLLFTFTGQTNAAIQQEILQVYHQSEILQRWFQKPEFWFFQLPEGEDVYIRSFEGEVGNQGYLSGPNQQFFRSLFALKDQCHCAYFMETDCLPLRPDWLGQLSDLVQAAESFWILGSPYRGKAAISKHFARHINGSAIYGVGELGFWEFAQEWQQVLAEIVAQHDPKIAYDCALDYCFHEEVALASPESPVFDPGSRSWQLFQRSAGYRRYTNTLLNYSDRADLEGVGLDWLRQLRQRFPDAYVVHHRGICEQVHGQMVHPAQSEAELGSVASGQSASLAAPEASALAQKSPVPVLTAKSEASGESNRTMAIPTVAPEEPLQLSKFQRGARLLRRLARYYASWRLLLAIGAVGGVGLAMVEELPYRGWFAVGGVGCVLVLVGHGAVRAEMMAEAMQDAIEATDEKATVAQRRSEQALKRSGRALKRLKNKQ